MCHIWCFCPLCIDPVNFLHLATRLLQVNAFRVQVENGLEDAFFAGFNPVSHIMISVVHTGGYEVIQVKHRRDVNLVECLFLIYLELLFSLYCNFWHIYRSSGIKVT